MNLTISTCGHVLTRLQGLGYGIFDGVTGIFTQPIKGAHKEGARGFFKGFGKGIGGAVCKPAAGETLRNMRVHEKTTC